MPAVTPPPAVALAVAPTTITVASAPAAPTAVADDAATPKTDEAPEAHAKHEATRGNATGNATVEFRVLPAATVVTVDGKPRQATDGGNHYVLQLRPGKHTIRAADPDGEQPTQSVDVELVAGDHERLKGFSFLP